MMWLVVLAIWTVAVTLVVARIVSVRRSRTEIDLPASIAVTLSVLPGGTAIVRLDVGADASSAVLAPLVEHAVSEALALKTVDVVEVRSNDGRLLDRRSRCDAIVA